MSAHLDRTLEVLANLWEEATHIWIDGGWAMIAIAVIALVMFSLGFSVYFKLRRKGFHAMPKHVWRRWISHPLERRGKIGNLLDFVTSAKTLKEISIYFDELRTTETAPIERDLRLEKICVSAAPLVGLLGTVTGMLATFGALSSGSGGEKTMSMVASGISEALITTETGLVIALPGLLFLYQLDRLHERYKAFLAHLESVCTQKLYRELQDSKHAEIDRAARQRIAERLLGGLTMQQQGNPARAASTGAADSPQTPSPI